MRVTAARGAEEAAVGATFKPSADEERGSKQRSSAFFFEAVPPLHVCLNTAVNVDHRKRKVRNTFFFFFKYLVSRCFRLKCSVCADLRRRWWGL